MNTPHPVSRLAAVGALVFVMAACGGGGGGDNVSSGSSSSGGTPPPPPSLTGDYNLVIHADESGILECVLSRDSGLMPIQGVSFSLRLSSSSYLVMDSSTGPVLGSGFVGVGRDQNDPTLFFVAAGLPGTLLPSTSEGEILSFRLRPGVLAPGKISFELEDQERHAMSQLGHFATARGNTADWQVTGSLDI